MISFSSVIYQPTNFFNSPFLQTLQESIIQQQRQKEILAKNVALYYNKQELSLKPVQTLFDTEILISSVSSKQEENSSDKTINKEKIINPRLLKQDDMDFDKIKNKEISYKQQEQVTIAQTNCCTTLDSSLNIHIISTESFEEDSMSKKAVDIPSSSTKDARLVQQNTQEQSRQINIFDNVALQSYTETYKQFHVTKDHMITERQQCLLDNMWHIQTSPQASHFKLKVLQALSTCFKEQNIEHVQDTQHLQFLQRERILLNEQIKTLEKKNTQLIQKLEKKDTQFANRDFNSFRTRILDTPWTQAMAPVIDRFPDFEELVSQKICSQFPLILSQLQQKLLNKTFDYSLYPRESVVERTDEEGTGTGLLLLQIKYPSPETSDDEIIQFYHYGMLDYIEFPKGNQADELIKRFGEKVSLTLNKLYSPNPLLTISCKIIASLPDASSHTYRPSRKRIFIHYNNCYPSYHLKSTMVTHGIHITRFPWLTLPPYMVQEPTFTSLQLQLDHDNPLPFSEIITKNQQTLPLPHHLHWHNYRLLAEGHYLQVYSTTNRTFIFPFLGEGDVLELEYMKSLHDSLQDMDEDDDPGSPQSIDSTHRDL